MTPGAGCPCAAVSLALLGLPVILVAGAAGAGVAAVTLTARNNALPGPDASVPPVAVAIHRCRPSPA